MLDDSAVPGATNPAAHGTASVFSPRKTQAAVPTKRSLYADERSLLWTATLLVSELLGPRSCFGRGSGHRRPGRHLVRASCQEVRGRSCSREGVAHLFEGGSPDRVSLNHPVADARRSRPRRSNALISRRAGVGTRAEMGTFYRGWSGALRRCTTALMMPQAAAKSPHQSWRNRESAPIAIQKTSRRLQNRFDRFPPLFRTLLSLATRHSSIKLANPSTDATVPLVRVICLARLSVSTFKKEVPPRRTHLAAMGVPSCPVSHPQSAP